MIFYLFYYIIYIENEKEENAMNLFELLNSDEKDMMEKYIDAYLFSNDDANYRTASLEYIMRE